MSIYQFVTKGVFLDQACENVYLLEHPDMSLEVLSNTVTMILDQMRGTLRLQWSNKMSLSQYTLRRVDAPGYPETGYTIPQPLIGARVEHPTFPQDTCNAYLYTGTLAPNRGRKYFGGFSEAGTSGEGEWLVDVTGTVENFLDLVLGQMSANPQTMARWVVGRWSVPNPGNPTAPRFIDSFNRVMTYRVSPVSGTQRRRKKGVGR